MTGHDDLAFEPVEGLPALPPKGETLLWQGRPHTWTLARDAFGLNWVVGYFVLIVLWRSAVGWADGGAVLALAMGLPYVGLGVAAYLVILLMAWVQARATVYTITTARVAMRIGAALSVTFNLPYAQVGTARLDLKRNGTGTIALETLGNTRLSYLVCWPHVRPWYIRHTQPALRCIPDAARVAGILAEAAETRISQPVITRGSASASALAAQ
ncbi:photosynthetic complex putative assembly protein PuhB [Paracoccaceae bacterium Fryx2]|nr:photosynthetic complex putative assembly protein PuhB [Paracoccaceae bacterium Fryx2]